MKITLFLAFLALSILFYGQEAKSKTCDCSELTMKGKNGNSAYLGEKPYSGKCFTKNEDGTVIQELNYYNGQLSGEAKSFYSNGNIKEIINYAFNMKHGPYFSYAIDGKVLIEGAYKNKQKDGSWNYYDESTGNLTKTIEYEFGKEKNRK